jgi:hypothetical protein
MPEPSNSASKRLVTQNLLVSAASHELQGRTTWDAIRDLSVFIEAFCLYDEIVVLGRQAYSMLDNRSDIIDAADQIIRVEQPSLDSRLVGTACGHLSAFLDEELESDRYERLFQSLFDAHSVELAFDIRPDGLKDFQSGEEWLRTVPNASDILEALSKEQEYHRGTTFLIRTFLYLAYADIHHLPFICDRTRAVVVEPMVQSERRLRKMLLEKLEGEFQKNCFSADISIRRNITPLASIVFDRAYPNPGNIAKEMVELRYDLAPLRERLGKIEALVAEGSRADELDVWRKWNRVFQEIENVYGAGEGLLSLEGTLAFAESAAELAEKPTSLKAASKILALPLNVLRRMVARFRMVEIYSMEFPSSERLQKTANGLFGDILEPLK